MRTIFALTCKERIKSVDRTVSREARVQAESNKWKANGYEHAVVTGPSSGGGTTNATCESPEEVADTVMAMATRNGQRTVFLDYYRKKQVEDLVREEHDVRCSACGDGGCFHCDPGSFGVRVSW